MMQQKSHKEKKLAILIDMHSKNLDRIQLKIFAEDLRFSNSTQKRTIIKFSKSCSLLKKQSD